MKTLRPRTTTRTRTPLVLRPLQEKMNYILREWLDSLMLGDAWNGAPPLIQIGGSHPLLGHEFSREPLEQTSPSNEELPRRRFEAVGPMARSAGLLLGPLTFSFSPWAALWAYLLMVCSPALFLVKFCSGGLLIHVDDVWSIGVCSRAQKGVIALHFHLNPALIKI